MQALVGSKTISFWLMDKDMYDKMAVNQPSSVRPECPNLPNRSLIDILLVESA